MRFEYLNLFFCFRYTARQNLNFTCYLNFIQQVHVVKLLSIMIIEITDNINKVFHMHAMTYLTFIIL